MRDGGHLRDLRRDCFSSLACELDMCVWIRRLGIQSSLCHGERPLRALCGPLEVKVMRAAISRANFVAFIGADGPPESKLWKWIAMISRTRYADIRESRGYTNTFSGGPIRIAIGFLASSRSRLPPTEASPAPAGLVVSRCARTHSVFPQGAL